MGDFAASVLDLEVRRSGKKILSGLNFQIEKGELVALVGASGAGKSTLLHALAGLVSIDSGSVEIARVGKVQTSIAFQDSVLLPWLSVRENVQFGFQFTAVSKAAALSKLELEERTDLILDRFGIRNLEHKRVTELSGGQAQRVGIARAALVEPSLLLLDEPFSAVDITTRKSLQSWLKSIVAELGLTAILVTHDIEEAISVAQRVFVLAKNGAELHEYHAGENASADLYQQISYQI